MKRNYKAGQGPVFLHMQKHPGIVYNALSLAEEMGLESDEDARSVNRSFVALEGKGEIERVGKGRYLYRKPPKEQPTKEMPVIVTGTLYEALGLRKSTGNIIVKDDANNLYELHEL